MNKITKYGWWALILIPLLFAFGIYVGSDRQSNQLVQLSCKEENIDWDIAVDALSKHYSDLRKQNPNEEIYLGSADIKKYFSENCEENLKIYEEYLASYDWVNKYFNNRVKELVGAERYGDTIKYYTPPKEFWGCENYLWDMKKSFRISDEIPPLMETKKYKEIIALSDKYYLRDSEIWYCDPYPWTQRAQG